MLLLLFSPGLLAQNIKDSFLIDKSKPFAYLVFDHIATQKPQYQGDDPKRLFLRVVNNCNIPIRFQVSDANPGPGVIVEHDVLPWPDPSEMMILSSPDEVRSYRKDRESALKHMPAEYSIHLGSLEQVQPGQSLLINMPRNHVSQYWFIRIGFEFFLEPLPKGTGPSMSLTFTDVEIPFSKR